MSNSAFVRVVAPGLPTWPALLFDAQRKLAVVSFRLATWRSWALASKVTSLMSWAASAFLGCWLWRTLEFIGNPIGRGSLALFGFGLTFTVTQSLVPAAFSGFLARRIFPSTGKAWFTAEEIAFRSRLYANGVIIWRTWNGQPVQARFDLAADVDACERRHQMPTEPVALATRLQSAQVVRLLVATLDPNRNVSSGATPNSVRAVPMFEADLGDGQKLTVVLNAAAAMTAKASGECNRKIGVDIDAIQA